MKEKVIGVILAGGRSSRMNGENKCFLKLGDLTLLNRAIDLGRSQVDHLVVNADFKNTGFENSDLKNNGFENTDLDIVTDVIDGHAGPLAGILSAMIWVRQHHSDCRWIATFPVDSPFYPSNLVSRLRDEQRKQNTMIVVPRFGQQNHWAFGLWSIDLIGNLQKYLVDQRQRKVQQWIKQQTCCEVGFDEYTEDPFFNINTPDDFKLAQERWQNLKH